MPVTCRIGLICSTILAQLVLMPSLVLCQDIESAKIGGKAPLMKLLPRFVHLCLR